MQLAQVLGVRSNAQSGAASAGNYQGYQQGGTASLPLFAPQATIPQSLFQPQNIGRSVVTAAGGVGSAAGAAQSQLPRGNVLDQYYTSLCQPAFPNISESPINPLGMFPVRI